MPKRSLRAPTPGTALTPEKVSAPQQESAPSEAHRTSVLANAVQATENAWLRIEHEYGMLTSEEVSAELGSTNKNLSDNAPSQRKQGKLIGVQRRNTILHPGFQLSNGEIHPEISRLIKAATKLDLPLEELTQWLCAPNEAFGGDKPVNHLNDPDDLLEALHNDFGAQW